MGLRLFAVNLVDLGKRGKRCVPIAISQWQLGSRRRIDHQLKASSSKLVGRGGRDG
jgi:hypothetical protein